MITLIKIGKLYYDEDELHKVLMPRIKHYTEETKNAILDTVEVKAFISEAKVEELDTKLAQATLLSVN